jgi:hypothetical protein
MYMPHQCSQRTYPLLLLLLLSGCLTTATAKAAAT